MRNLLTKKWIVTSIRLFLGFVLFGAGMSKLYENHAFPGIIGPVWLEEELAKYGLGLFARFVAMGQVVAGGLLLTQRFATLGAVMSFPMLLCILMVTISLQWQGTPYVNAVFLAMNSYLLAYDYHKLKFLIAENSQSIAEQPLKRYDKKGDLLWGLAFGLILLSIPLSYIHLESAWLLSVTCLLLIGYVQIFRKRLLTKAT